MTAIGLTLDAETRAQQDRSAASVGTRPLPLGLGLGTGILVMAIGVGVAAVELAYAGRSGTSWGGPAYWLGEIMIFLAATYGVLRSRWPRPIT